MSRHNLTQAIDIGRQARELLLKQGRHLDAIEQDRNDFMILMEIRDWLKSRSVKTEDGRTGLATHHTRRPRRTFHDSGAREMIREFVCCDHEHGCAAHLPWNGLASVQILKSRGWLLGLDSRNRLYHYCPAHRSEGQDLRPWEPTCVKLGGRS